MTVAPTGPTGPRSLDVDGLARAARAARRHAYAPYSGFRVGAVAVAADGTTCPGANVENASYGLSVCAERVAMFRAVADGKRRLRAVAVCAGGAAPCGACLQVMAEFGVETVILVPERGAPRVHALADLLPHPFALRPS